MLPASSMSLTFVQWFLRGILCTPCVHVLNSYFISVGSPPYDWCNHLWTNSSKIYVFCQFLLPNFSLPANSAWHYPLVSGRHLRLNRLMNRFLIFPKNQLQIHPSLFLLIATRNPVTQAKIPRPTLEPYLYFSFLSYRLPISFTFRIYQGLATFHRRPCSLQVRTIIILHGESSKWFLCFLTVPSTLRFQ